MKRHMPLVFHKSQLCAKLYRVTVPRMARAVQEARLLEWHLKLAEINPGAESGASPACVMDTHG